MLPVKQLLLATKFFKLGSSFTKSTGKVPSKLLVPIKMVASCSMDAGNVPSILPEKPAMMMMMVMMVMVMVMMMVMMMVVVVVVHTCYN